MKKDTLEIGRAGEYRVLSELLFHGHNPAVKAVDNGVDIVLENGNTIQVKTVNRFDYKERSNVTLCSAAYKKGKRVKHPITSKADFIIIWIIPKNIFYIIPFSSLGDNKIGLWLGSKKSRYEGFIGKWNLLNVKVGEKKNGTDNT